ncbi:MAG: transcriptional regulator, GntR family [Xanthobacteraceae bacterium]|jgi:DNA-binding GntR family transcriptional regulator|nr:transcriptional regulator, GntR family [Xanthobacteraceae bacterium]
MQQGRDQAQHRSAQAARVQTGATPRLNERAAEILSGRIRAGSLAAGARLLESHVAQEFGISRAPARQALERLEALGLVARAEPHGYEVRSGAAVEAGKIEQVDAEIQLTASATWERIYKEVEQEIVSRTGFASWRVVENHLAAHYGVSRTVAREVIARLQQRGVVKKDGKLRWFAPALTPRYVGELYEMRALLEPAALAAAVPKLPAGTAERLRDHLLAAIGRAETLSGDELSALEAELHVDLLAHCGNGTLMEAVTTYQSLLVAHSFLYRWAPRLYAVEPFLSEHLAIAERLTAGDAAGAALELRRHLQTSLDRAIHRLEMVRREFRPTPLPYLESLD